jgi:hypothetical protein
VNNLFFSSAKSIVSFAIAKITSIYENILDFFVSNYS